MGTAGQKVPGRTATASPSEANKPRIPLAGMQVSDADACLWRGDIHLPFLSPSNYHT